MALAQFAASHVASSQNLHEMPAATLIIGTTSKPELEPIMEEQQKRMMTPSLVAAAPYTSQLRKNHTMSADQIKFNMHGIRQKIKKGLGF